MKNNNFGGFETKAVNALLDRMIAAGATEEEFAKVANYSVAARDCDFAQMRLTEVSIKADLARSLLEESAKLNNIKEISKKYNCSYGTRSFAVFMDENVCPTCKYEEKTSANIEVGDQITIELDGFGEFTATVHKVTDDAVMFIFDEYVTSRPMNEKNTNDGGFEKSDLNKWLCNDFLKSFPANLRERILGITIPSVGEITGWEDDWDKEHFEPDNCEQLPLMKKRRNRVAYLDNEPSWGWLRNATKKEYSSACFASVGPYGSTGSGASGSHGVRPVFWLAK